ncbi:MAG TPA: BlaI/MecI/CopY family transcriptional regulator [Planctomycetota bacterium]|nr:BlaI/MecI/CopY family transcriptional regulator [Planctomycetota bacterium]
MSRRSSTRPTDAELEILRILWRRGMISVREVHDELNLTRPTGYTTALKLLQIMTDKRLVRRDESGRAHLYEALESQEGTQGRLVRDLAERAFGGSAAELVQRALSQAPASANELATIRLLIEDLERRQQ